MRLGRRTVGWLALLLLGMRMLGVRAQESGPGDGGFAGGQRVQGTVTAVAGDRLTVKTETGETYQVVTTTNTRVMKDRQPVKVAQIPVGSGVGALGLLDAPTKTVHAMVVFVVDPEQVKKAREGLGKVYIMGKVTKIDETALTIQRVDGVAQTIEVDEGTSFKRGRRRAQGEAGGASADAGPERGGVSAESITLPDIKVGDSLGGPGEVKHGTFVAKELTVFAPGAGRRRGGGGAAAGTGEGPASAGQGPR